MFGISEFLPFLDDRSLAPFMPRLPSLGKQNFVQNDNFMFDHGHKNCKISQISSD